MTRRSEPEFLVLHAVRLLGFGDSPLLAERAGTSHAEALRVLSEAERAGWVQYLAFADLAGWSLTDAGKAENERRLAAERADADREGVIESTYRRFLPLNARLLRAVTDWQIKPTEADRFAPNDHSDQAWDERILAELTALGRELALLTERLHAVLARFDGYAVRYASALDQAKGGRHQWIDSTDVNSCHRTWFQLHEDLIATLGVDRGREVPGSPA
ncbi:transcriptional regulator [Myceligenerans crystallogenes]|uniref:Transcriptional regulator n=1 Tax=Myceligenerans crystallogenes TaxID=316335 RepID=A0ABN2NIJ7_9MICO